MARSNKKKSKLSKTFERSRPLVVALLFAMVGVACILLVSAKRPIVTTSDACGATLYKAGGGAWKCTFIDDFPGTQLDSTKWTPVTTATTGTGSVGKSECRIDSPNNISVSGGTLRLTIRKETAPIVCQAPTGSYTTPYTAGAVSTGRKFSQTYGRYEVRAKFPSTTVSGLHSAIWMWPQDRKYGAASGEIDIAEYRTVQPDRAIPTIHYQDGDKGYQSGYNCLVNRPGEFHTYAVEWTPSTMTFIYDGKACYVNTWKPASPLVSPAPFDEPYFIILNQSKATATTGWNAFSDATPLPATMEVDYVKVWQ